MEYFGHRWTSNVFTANDASYFEEPKLFNKLYSNSRNLDLYDNVEVFNVNNLM